ncbi:MAG: hypothetical protein KGM43_07235 [Planctomycetota bacterium]|nr:hypothetical protein [Planctomycetota bacterium]
MPTRQINRRFAGMFIVMIAVALTGADDAKKIIDAGGMVFEAPTTWKSSPPRSNMRRAQLKVGPEAGDEEPGELVVYAFPGGAGTVDDNIKRWEGQFLTEKGGRAKADTKQVKTKNTTATRVEITGRYVAPLFPGSNETNDKPNYRLLGAIVITDTTGYFFKLIGPEKTLVKHREEFDKLVDSIKVEEQK